jgi:ferritin
MNPKRLQTALLEKTEQKLNQQIQMEAESSWFYLGAASWCERMGFVSSANFLYHHTDEEREHMMKLFRYVNEVGGHALAPALPHVKHEWASLREVFEMILEHEVKVTKSINELVDFTFKNKDFATFQFLQWYVAEQREEEALARRLIEIFDIIGENTPNGLYLIDKEIGKLGHGGESSYPGKASNDYV